ncbi:hypothetical protein K501DRAFT_272683 [Backusella circina FSU 941]|nr:hypothetical protein K501DRAFT_272683 [Backusella circina FSU 941]
MNFHSYMRFSLIIVKLDSFGFKRILYFGSSRFPEAFRTLLQAIYVSVNKKGSVTWMFSVPFVLKYFILVLFFEDYIFLLIQIFKRESCYMKKLGSLAVLLI